jgi:hypothetical protein
VIGEIYRTQVQGTHCGAPYSFSLAYAQLQPVDGNPGLALATAWWAVGGPGPAFLGASSDKLKALCMQWSSPTDVGAVLLQDKQGANDESLTLPPTVAVMFHIRPLTPWPGSNRAKPKYDVGRFFLPGVVNDNIDEFQLNSGGFTAYRSFSNACVNIQIGGATAFRLVAFPEFVTPPGGDVGARSCQPDALLRRIKTRKPNACELFAGTGQVGDRPMLP